MMGRNKRTSITLIVLLVGGITFLHYSTQISDRKYQLFYQGLFFLPVILSGVWFGLRGALATSLSITLLYLPFAVIHWERFSAADFNNIMEMVLYNVAAAILGTLRDQRQKAHEQSVRAESLAAVGRAISGVAHDMKTPLMGITGLTRLVRKHMADADPDRGKLDLIIKESERLENMVREMLDFSRPLELNRTLTAVGHLVEETVAIIGDVAREKGVEVELQSSPDMPEVSLDSMRMKQALINLIINAIEASPEKATVSVSSDLSGSDLVVEVSDDGSGISLDRRQEIFVPFFSTKKKGTGLGLPIAKKIVEAHRGRIEVLENSREGATFRITIPVTHTRGSASPPAVPSHPHRRE